MIILMAAKQKAKDKREEPSLNGKAGIVMAVKVTTDGSGGLLCSCMIPSELILLGTTDFLPPLFLYCHIPFLDSKACL